MDCQKWDVNEVWSEISINRFILEFGLLDMLKDIKEAGYGHHIKTKKIIIRKAPVSFYNSLNNYIYDLTSDKYFY